MGFTKNWCVAKVLKTKGSKKILREMDKGSLRSLEKFFFFFWRRNGEVKKKNEGEDEGE